MHLSGTSLVRVAAVPAAGLAALALATPAHAADDPPPPPVVRAAVLGLRLAARDDAQSSVAAAASAVRFLVDQENRANTPPPASATTQADTVGQRQSQAISPTHAQKSPERASTTESQQSTGLTPSDELQYHQRHVQYQRPANVRPATPRLVLPMRAFSAREPKRITPQSSQIEPPNWPRNGAPNCRSDPDGSLAPGLPADGGATLQCTPDPAGDDATSDDPPADEETSVDPPDLVDCDDTGAQYQPDDAQYQASVETTCDAPDDPVVPIAEPVEPVPTSPGEADTAAATAGVPPTTEPLVAPVAPDTESTQCGPDVLPPAGPHAAAARRVTGSRFIGKPSPPRLSSPKQQSRGEREISAQGSSVTQSIAARPSPRQAPNTEAKSSISSRMVEATASRLVKPASSRASVFRGWFVASVTLSFVLALGLLLSAVAITVGRSLRARVGSKGLSDHRVGASRRGGIRYRE
jgi:hypothetical protein